MRFLLIAAPLLLSIAWFQLDANPTLFLYDLGLSLFRSQQTKFASLRGKTVWVTGASSGIGAELVCQLVEAEVGQVILSASNRERLLQVARECGQRRSTTASTPTTTTTVLSVLPYDARDANTTESTVRKALELVADHHSIDVLFLNAGIYQVQPALQTTRHESQKIMRINYETPVELALALMHLDRWKERGYGHIVVTASLVSRGGHSLASTYSASKHALMGYFQSLSTEEFPWLRVDLVCPGAVATNLWNALGKDVSADERAKVPVRRCVQLMLTGVTGPWLLFYETWISKAPGLLWITLSSYTPRLFHVAIHAFGVARLAIWESTSAAGDQRTIDALNLVELITALWNAVRNPIPIRDADITEY
jgi:NAD(P)-dependent dehydrogenase (short-subunit alcohol dehydrogenase family)